MGVTVRQKRRGRGQPWWVFVHANGLIRSKKVGDRAAAESLASAMRRRLKAGELAVGEAPDRTAKPTFGEYADRYLETYAKTACKRTTWWNYGRIIELHLKPAWAGRRLDAVTRADVKRLLLQKQQDGLAPGTVNNIKNLISGIFTHACEDEILVVNPALRMGRLIRRQDGKRHVQPLTRPQAAAFLAAAQAEWPQYYPLFLCAFRTGMRLGELLGLAWEDVDFEAAAIEVRRGFTHGHFATPKSHRSRTVDMSDQLRTTLQSHHAAAALRWPGGQPAATVPAVGRGPEAVHLVFPARNGQPLDGDNLRHRAFRAVLAGAGLPRVRFHDIRHTFASLLLAQGESLQYVKEQMGHASIQTTVDVYGHLIPGANRRAVNALDDAAGLRPATG